MAATLFKALLCKLIERFMVRLHFDIAISISKKTHKSC